MSLIGDILSQFGVAWPKFLAQVLIFLILYVILSKFAFGPILEILENRRRRIAEGEKNLEQIRKDLAEAEDKSKEILTTANQEADRLIAEARDSAEVVGNQKRQEAVSEASEIIEKAREATELEREQVMAQLKEDFGRLVIETTSKVSGKVLTDTDQKKINKEAAAQVSL